MTTTMPDLLRPLPLLLPAVLLAACQTIPKAPKDSPRVEIEVATTLDDDFVGFLDGIDDEFARAVADKAQACADVGLRFYAVPTTSYAAGHARPTYLMRVHVEEVEVSLADAPAPRKTSETAGEESGAAPAAEPAPRTVQSVACRVSALIEARRSGGPPLLVGRSEGKARVSASTGDPGTHTGLALRNEPGIPPRVRRDDLLAAIDRALRTALGELVPAIDREQALRAR